MERDHESSDSSSWSLVDVNDSSSDDGTDASDIDSVGDDLIVESVHDSDSEFSSDEDDDADVVSEAEEATEESELDEPLEAEEAEEIEIKKEESEVEEEEPEQEEIEDSEDEEKNEIDESESVEVVEEEEVMAEAAALHFVEPAKVAVKFEELSKTMETPFDQFFESISTPESGTRSLIFAIVMFITVLGAGFGHYIGGCLIGSHHPITVSSSSSMIGGPFCYESDRITTTSALPPFMMQQQQQPGLQYQDVDVISSSMEEPSTPPSSPLEQCKENLYDAQAEVKMKSGVNRFVRENYKRQLQKAKEEFESRLESYKRASRRLLATKYSAFEKQKPSKPDLKSEEEDSICKSFERPFLNLTRSIFSSVSNWSSNNSVVKNFIKFSPAFDKSLEKVSSWLRRSNNFSNNVYQHFHSSLTTVKPKLSKALNEVPKKAWNILRSDFRKYAKKVTTALSKTNIQTKIMEYKKLPIIQKFKTRMESALSRLSELKTHAEEVCFASSKDIKCEESAKFAKNLESILPEFSGLIGKRNSKEYLQYLNSLSAKNCSHQMACEKDWWTGCGPQFLENCQLRKWQNKRVFSGAALINRNRKMKENAVEMGWILPKDRRSPVRCCHLSNSPLPCPSTNVLPDLPQDSLAPCHAGLNSASHPCQQQPQQHQKQTAARPPRPCPASNQPCKPSAFNKPSGNGRPVDWLLQRATIRAAQRQSNSHKLFTSAKSPLHFKNRRKQHA